MNLKLANFYYVDINGCTINNDKKFLTKYFDVLELKHANITYQFKAWNSLFQILIAKVMNKTKNGRFGAILKVFKQILILKLI